jgi:hypothetical protein
MAIDPETPIHSHSIISWRLNSLMQFQFEKRAPYNTVRNTVSKFRFVAIDADRRRIMSVFHRTSTIVPRRPEHR